MVSALLAKRILGTRVTLPSVATYSTTADVTKTATTRTACLTGEIANKRRQEMDVNLRVIARQYTAMVNATKLVILLLVAGMVLTVLMESQKTLLAAQSLF